jgi:hypothetical protein
MMNPQANLATDGELRAEGWEPFEIRWLDSTSNHHRYGPMRSFDVVGAVPSGPGLYIFTLGREFVDIRYCGKSKDLWMVAYGKLWYGTPRGGNRYGRPKTAGDTRQWVNSQLTQHLNQDARMWTRAVPGATESELLEIEDACIDRWCTWQLGWNRTGRPLSNLLRLFEDI